MPALRRKMNYRNIVLSSEQNSEGVGVRLKSGDYTYKRWLGFVSREQAGRWQMEQLLAIPVKLEINAYSQGEGLGYPWHELSRGQYIQGCLTGLGVYGVLDRGTPRLI